MPNKIATNQFVLIILILVIILVCIGNWLDNLFKIKLSEFNIKKLFMMNKKTK